jgi:hypothetical protein
VLKCNWKEGNARNLIQNKGSEYKLVNLIRNENMRDKTKEMRRLEKDKGVY